MTWPRESPVQSLFLNFTPTKLDRFGDASVFLLNTASQGPRPCAFLVISWTGALFTSYREREA